jgi:hypothetical protein
MSDGDQSGSVRTVRTSGVIDRARGFGLHDHVFWAYEDPENLRVGVRDFLAEGLAQGQRVCYVASGDPETLAEDLAGIAGLAEALTRGAAQIVPLDATYSMGTLIEPASQVHTYAGQRSKLWRWVLPAYGSPQRPLHWYAIRASWLPSPVTSTLLTST